jgi:hypothetical protein
MILEYIYRVKSLGVFMENLKFLRIIALAPEMYDCKVISPKMLDPRAFQNIHQSWKSNI